MAVSTLRTNYNHFHKVVNIITYCHYDRLHTKKEKQKERTCRIKIIVDLRKELLFTTLCNLLTTRLYDLKYHEIL